MNLSQDPEVSPALSIPRWILEEMINCFSLTCIDLTFLDQRGIQELEPHVTLALINLIQKSLTFSSPLP